MTEQLIKKSEYKKGRNSRPYFLALTIFIVFVILFFVLLIQSRLISFVYRPYLINHLLLVFTNNNDDLYNENSNLDFLLSDLQNLQGKNRNVGVIVSDHLNSKKDIKDIVPHADRIYVDIFSGEWPIKNNFSYFNNEFMIYSPFEISSHISESTRLRIVYNKDYEKIDFVFLGQPIEINGDLIKLNDIIVFSIEDIEKDSLIEIADLTISLSNYQSNLFTTTGDLIKRGVRKFKFRDTNLVNDYNFSFEDGFWVDQVANCSSYLPGSPEISMSLRNEASEGDFSMELSSSNHFACTFKSFPISFDATKFYKLVFDYKNIEGKKIQYYYNLNNDSGEVQEKFGSFDAKNSDWNTFETIIDPKIQNSSEFSLYFYAPSDGSKKITSLYDNIRIYSFELEEEFLFPQLDFPKNYGLFNWTFLGEGKNVFRFSSNQDNFLEQYNFSFEDGFWVDQVANCSSYLPGSPEISMSLRNEASEGDFSMELSSSNHFACTFKSFPISFDATKFYKLVFDYKNIEGKKIQYYYNLNNDSGEVQEKFGSFDAKNSDWNTFETIIDPKIQNSSEFSLYFYAPSDGSKKITSLYDNIRIYEVAPKEIYSYYLVSSPKEIKIENKPLIKSEMVNNWKTKVSLLKINKPVMIVYPKSFSSYWRMYPVAKSLQVFDFFSPKISDKKHFRLNNQVNGWLIDVNYFCESQNLCDKNQDGSYNIDLIIEHAFNKFFNIGLIIFGLIIIISGHYFIRKRNVFNL